MAKRGLPSYTLLLVLLNVVLFLTLLLTGASLNPFATRWYRGNVHTHTRFSDGDSPPDLVLDWYRSRGYDFVALTDHDRLLVHLDPRDAELPTFTELARKFNRPGRFIVMHGEEITAVMGPPGAVHMNAYPLKRPVQGRRSGPTAVAMQRAVSDVEHTHPGEGVAVQLNHPTMDDGIQPADIVAVPDLRLFEVYNGITGGWQDRPSNKLSPDQIWDHVLAARYTQHPIRPLFGLATDDAHDFAKLGNARPGRGWIMVRSPSLTEVDIVASIRRGDFYSSSGVTLMDVQGDSSGLRLTIAGEPGLTYETTFYGTRQGGKPGEALGRVHGTEADYRFTGDELYIRAKVVSSRLHQEPTTTDEMEKAWTQPVPGPRAAAEPGESGRKGPSPAAF